MRRKLKEHSREALKRTQRHATGLLTFVARETSSTLKVGFFSPKVRHDESAHGEDLVILVHGLFATAGAFSPLVDHLHEQLGVDARSFSFLPGASLTYIAHRIDRECRNHHKSRRIHLVGHSMGGLACRLYVQSAHHDVRIVQTISIASPFCGIAAANLLPQSLRRLILPLQGELNALLLAAPPHLIRVPHLSIVADRDQLVFPMEMAILPGTPSFVLHDTGHNGALFHPKLLTAVEHAVRERSAHHTGDRQRAT